ncbi:MAG TPA: endolytic transglycosylase MltG [Bacteroidales bacterium]|nr:endolytic transglycosylase MltG [Bacteroidales bacterium]
MKKVKFFLVSLIGIATILALILILNIDSIRIKTDEPRDIYIKTGSTYNEIINMLISDFDIEHPDLFRWVAEKKNYDILIKPGKYSVESEMTYFELIDMLRSGKQKPIKLTFNNVRTLNQLAGKVGGKIEADSASIIEFLSDESNYTSDGFSSATVISVFLPNTYELFWNTDAKGFYTRMLREYNSFWNDERLARAAKLSLSRNEVSILASIVDDEVAKAKEKPRIAGVYLNRIRVGMPLQACPTIKFALNDFTITRVLNKHLTIESPYNTYKYRGFPPGPVGCPSIEGIESVLNAEKHDYLYFAAKSDFSGYHNFSRTLAEHNRYANQYQKELDRRRIFK